jgi:hypothetical protein
MAEGKKTGPRGAPAVIIIFTDFLISALLLSVSEEISPENSSSLGVGGKSVSWHG